MKVTSTNEEQVLKDDEIRISKSKLSSISSQFPSMPSQGFPFGPEVQATSAHDELTSSVKNGIEANKFEIVETKMNQTAEGKQEYVVQVPGLEISSPTISQVIFKPCPFLRYSSFKIHSLLSNRYNMINCSV